MVNNLASRIDRDQLHMVPRDVVAGTAHHVLHTLGSSKPGPEVIASVAVLFAVMAERSQMDPQELSNLGRRILFADDQFHHKPNVQLEALRDYAGLRLRNDL